MTTDCITGFGSKIVRCVNADPTSNAVDAPAGSLIIFGGEHYRKLTDGENTDVIRDPPSVGLISNTILGGWDPSANLVAHYKLDRSEKDNVVWDSSPNAYHGTLEGGDFSEDKSVAGLVSVGNAFDLNGSDDKIHIDNVVAPMKTAAGAIFVTAKPDDIGAIRSFVSFGDTDGNNFISFRQDNALSGGIKCQLRLAGTDQWRFTSNAVHLANGVKTGLVLVHDGVAPKLFALGVEVAISFDVTTDKTAWCADIAALDNCRIGALRFNGANSQFFDGVLDDIRFYNAALSIPQDILGIYNNGDGTQSEAGFVPLTPSQVFDFLSQSQQAHIIDADGTLADITTKFNTLLASLETLKLLASS